MDTNIDFAELDYVLEKLIALHRNLIDVLREEHSHMVAADVKSISEAAHAKEVLLSEVWSHEQLRIKIAKSMAASLNIAAEAASLKALATALPAKDQAAKLHHYRTVLDMLVNEARQLNLKNMAFAESSLSRIEEMKKNVLGLNNNAPKENYSNSGVRQAVTEQGGRLLSTEA